MPRLNVTGDDLLSILPALALIAGALGAVGVEVFVRREARRAVAEVLMYLSILGSLGIVLYRLGKGTIPGFDNAVRLDALALFLSFGILAATGLTAVLSADALKGKNVPTGEFHGLLLLGAAGMMLLVQSVDLVTFFVSLEILSLAVYILSGALRNEPRSNEAAAKYLILGAFATGFLLYGVALLYGATGSLSLYGIGEALASMKEASPLALLGFAMLAVGLAFKVGAVPFHQWIPDVYEGAPTVVTAFMSVAVKAAAFGALLRVLLTAGVPHVAAWRDTMFGLALATIVVANLLALWQRNVKRMLAYSSVAHTGYLLVGMAALGAPGDSRGAAATASVFYLFSYTFMTLGAFAFVILAGRGGRDAEDLDDYAGLAKRRPWSAAAMTVFLVSLAGIPPTAGFLGKFLVFKAAIQAEEYALVIVGVLGSAVSVYYYLRVVVAMYMKPDPSPDAEAPAPNVTLVVMACALFTLVLGILPGTFLEYSRQSMRALIP